MPANKQQLIDKLKTTTSALKQVVYETGPTGYSLARHLEKAKHAGICCGYL